MVQYVIFIYSILLIITYFAISFFAILEIKSYLQKNRFTNYTLLAASKYTPSISILAPAYNEGQTIIENARSLLSLYYSNFEVIIINDGSKDDSLQKLIQEFELENANYFINYQINTKEVKAVYKSKNPIYKKLIVIDKVNGGKADALNTGINIASNKYLVCIDVDCVLENDALLKMIKPFLEQTDKRVIATGGVVRVANSCIIEHGRLVKVNLPTNFLARMQSLEYIRAFILGRMAWSHLNGLLLISGAFGAFDKEIVIACGGYNANTVGEDMELVVRMRRYMEEKKEKYVVSFIPDPLCWTEVPSSSEILKRQRNRWLRGTFETLKLHKKLFFNPAYHITGLLSYPYWFLFELCAPLVEFFGLVFFLLSALTGLIEWNTFFAYLFLIILLGYLYSIFAICLEIITYNQYRRQSDIVQLIIAALLEPFYFHPLVVWSSIKGFVSLITKNKGWGEMTRVGFTTQNKTQPIAQAFTELLPAETKRKRLSITNIFFNLTASAKQFISITITLFLLLLAARLVELIQNTIHNGFSNFTLKTYTVSLIKDISFYTQIAGAFCLFYFLLAFIHKTIAKIILLICASSLVLLQLALSQYFLRTSVLLGSDLWGYSSQEILQTIGSSGIFNIKIILLALLIITATGTALIFIPKRIKCNSITSYTIVSIFLLSFLFNTSQYTNQIQLQQEFSNNLTINKPFYFITTSIQHFFPSTPYNDIYADTYIGDYGSDNEKSVTSFINYIDEKKFPFLHTMDSTDVLSNFFNSSVKPPNIVIILVEGLGRAFSNKGAYLGSFTPFIDSLSEKSLYWENFLSEGGRTFAVLPSVTASLPFAKNGFSELGNLMPPHFSLMSILNNNNYTSNFYYGGNADFDNMHLFLQKNKTKVHDEQSFSPSLYKKMPATNGFTWGYGDKDLFKKILSETTTELPFINIALTVSTHDPFIINEEDKYLQKFEERMNELGLDETQKKEHRNYEKNYATILYMDDAIKYFFNLYSKTKEFNNTIFIITGDHRMPEIPMSSKIDRYHVPLIIYSPLLKRTAKFSSISTHFDITPSLLMLLHNTYHLKIPTTVSWMGTGLDTVRSFRNIHAYPLMQTKTEINDFIMEDYMLSGNNLYSISNNLDISLIENDSKKQQLINAMNKFKYKNNQLLSTYTLLPDSLLKNSN